MEKKNNNHNNNIIITIFTQLQYTKGNSFQKPIKTKYTLEIRNTVRDARKNVRKYKNERETSASASESAIIRMSNTSLFIFFVNNYFFCFSQLLLPQLCLHRRLFDPPITSSILLITPLLALLLCCLPWCTNSQAFFSSFFWKIWPW